MRFAKTAAALCLALCLAVPAWAAPSQPQAEQRREDLDFLYETMRDYHPNLFANTPESEFLARKGEIEAALDRSDDVTFILPNSGLRVSMSQKYIVMADYMECGIGLGVTPIQPDLYVAQTVSDFLAGRDTVVEALLARTEHFVTVEQPQAP